MRLNADDTGPKRLTDEAEKEEIKKVSLGNEIAEMKNLPKTKRDEIIKMIKQVDGLSKRQAVRIIGVSPNIVFKA